MYAENFRRFSSVTRVDLVFEAKTGELTAFFDSTNDSPMINDPHLRQSLQARAHTEDICLLRDDDHVYYAVVTCAEGWLYAGPMCSERLDPDRLRQYYHNHNITAADVHTRRTFTLREITDIVILLTSDVRGTPPTEKEIQRLNHSLTESIHRRKTEQTHIMLQEEEQNDDGAWRHTYHEEQQLMQAVQEGRARDAVRIAENMDRDVGRLSAREYRHWRNLAIVDITLCARAAIQGGVLPETAYRVSGYYILKCDTQREQTQILAYRNTAIEDLCAYVNLGHKRANTSNYTGRCKDYINKHYREKIYLDELAVSLGISPAYLSRMFKRDTGICLQDYVNQVRVERAASLLVYSQMSLPTIAHYVGFPNQSYFGKMFRRFQNMTPKEYRNAHQAGEFLPKG